MKRVEIPVVIDRALRMGATLAVSGSGGKDSDALLRQLASLHKKQNYPGRIFAIFADLGRIEWLGVPEHLHKLCGELGIELEIVKRPQGGMIDRWEQRMQSIAVDSVIKHFQLSDREKKALKGEILENIPSVLFQDDAAETILEFAMKLGGFYFDDGDLRNDLGVVCQSSSIVEFLSIESIGEKPFFSSAQNRYCTDHLKVSQIDKRLRRIGDQPFFSSSSNRYCTSELKRQQIDKNLRADQLIICAIGIRAEESPNRAKEPRYCVRSNISAKYLEMALPAGMSRSKDKAEISALEEAWADEALDLWLASGYKGRLAFSWHPIHNFTLEEVWATNGSSMANLAARRQLWALGAYRDALEGFPGHWAYVSGNSRLSCSQCVLASGGDIANGAMLNPLPWLEIVLMEERSGWTFRQDLALSSLWEKVQGLNIEERRKILNTLYELNLVWRWKRNFTLEFLSTCDLDHLQFWTIEFLEKLLSGENENGQPCDFAQALL